MRRRKLNIAVDKAGRPSMVSATPAMWVGPRAHVSDYAFVPSEDTESLVRHARQGVLWAHRLIRVDHPFDVDLARLDRASEAAWQNNPSMAPARQWLRNELEKNPHMTHPPQLREQAARLRAEGLLTKDIAQLIGVPQPTVIRWLNPALEARGRVVARKTKYSKRRKCLNCNRRVSDTSVLCLACYKKKNLAERPWPRERVIESIQRWAAEKGAPPSYQQWLKSGGDQHPSMWTIVRGPNPVFESWQEALDAAGFGRWKRKQRLSREERAAIRRDFREQKLKKP